ncbi:MAG: signal recognition particle subunit SRP19/SEC65 family protein [Methanomicrobiaceae archaeon]|uniref:Signal recognition particle 19 kDa protein (Srp19) n=1 Tax=hydrocarbon metagenome TaxID=938273 RepID=A0A0W8FFA7_9ZZZZ|nr:signal recognition particle subunit SRP19/SEC65 family protein [Methanomicrobiaceae archaeon]MDD5419071.1 signal recognition particle subunit SRP19/SEC65 family protein [Methanomicrobiaceae archaeon]
MSNERILYPCYFDASLKRREGRRVPRSMAIKSPTITDLANAAKKAGLTYRVEEHSHPACWTSRDGRIAVAWDESKEALLKRVARHLEAKKVEPRKPEGRK